MPDSPGPVVRIAHHGEGRVELWEAYYLRATGERVTLRWFTEAEAAYDYASRRDEKLGRAPRRRPGRALWPR